MTSASACCWSVARAAFDSSSAVMSRVIHELARQARVPESRNLAVMGMVLAWKHHEDP